MPSERYAMDMFDHLFDFAFKRTAVQAFGFFLAFLMIIILGGALIGSMGGLLTTTKEEAFQLGLRLGNILAVLASVGLCWIVLRAKNLHTHFGWFLMLFLSGFLAVVAGGIGGLLPIAYLTTQKKRK